MERVSSIAERLKEYRTRHNMSFSDMEHITGVPAQTLNRYELGQRSPKLDIAVAIAESLHVHPMWLQGYDVPETENTPTPEVGDGREKLVQELFNSLSDNLKSEAVRYLQYLAEQKGNQ